MSRGPGLGFTTVELFSNGVDYQNMPAAATEFPNQPIYRRQVELEGFTRVRSYVGWVQAAGAAGAILQAEYTTDLTGASGWTALCTNTLSLASTGPKLTAWEDIPEGARNKPIMLRINGSGGDGVADPLVVKVGIDLA